MTFDKMIAKFTSRDAITPEEEAILRSLATETRSVPADKVFIAEDEELTNSTILVEGLVCRFKDFVDGERQISALHVPGDFIDLHSFTLKHLDHSIMALTPCVIGLVPHEKLNLITETHPHLTRLLWFSTTMDAALHREWALSLGRRDALERMAHLFCELFERFDVVGLAEPDGYELEISQQELGECLGLSAVHVNRTLKVLRERNLLLFRSGRVHILDLAALKAVAQFDGNYLYLRKRASSSARPLT